MGVDMEKYINLYHNNSAVKTLEEFMVSQTIPTSRISVDDLFDYNRQTIFAQMTWQEKRDYAQEIGIEDWNDLTADDLKSDMTLPCPCVMRIETKYIEYATTLAISQSNFEVQTDDVYAFENEQIQNIVQNAGYRIDRSTKKIRPDCSVFGWFKSLYYMDKPGDKNSPDIRSNDQKIIDISDYIIDLTTNVELGGGNFQITLPIINSHAVDRAYGVKEIKSDIPFLKKVSGVSIPILDKVAGKKHLYRFDNDKQFFHKTDLAAMEQNYFNWLIQSNDLIFISFEPLELEYNENTTVFDMIGLVDTVTVNQNANGQGSVTVQGKDLMKLLMEDSSLFFNYSTVWGDSQIFCNSESMGKQGDIRETDRSVGELQGKENAPIRRLRFITGEIDAFATTYNRNIDFIMKAVISQLANIQIVPDSVFEDWGNRRTRFSEITPQISQSSNSTAAGESGGDGNVPNNPAFGYRGDYGNINPPSPTNNNQRDNLINPDNTSQVLRNPFAVNGDGMPTITIK